MRRVPNKGVSNEKGLFFHGKGAPQRGDGGVGGGGKRGFGGRFSTEKSKGGGVCLRVVLKGGGGARPVYPEKKAPLR